MPHDAPSLSRTVPHDGPRYPYDGAGDSDKALAGAGRGNLHIRQQAHSTPHSTNHMQHGQHRILLLHSNSQAEAIVMKKIGT